MLSSLGKQPQEYLTQYIIKRDPISSGGYFKLILFSMVPQEIKFSNNIDVLKEKIFFVSTEKPSIGLHYESLVILPGPLTRAQRELRNFSLGVMTYHIHYF